MWKNENDINIEKGTDALVEDFIQIIKPKPFTAAFVSKINKWRQSLEATGNLIFQRKLDTNDFTTVCMISFD